ncbi:MAG: methyltransferase domain-containing protein [Rhizobiales bacterium]|nr:methyltransferase domain-containing protein [Hyphomicrobiales bacterium]NRB15636.1 methyltransferase domain-containing protein [Hyphomicrobiales bacterium]
MSQIHEDVKQYYGETLTTKDDLLTSACCPTDAMPAYLQPLVANIHDEILSKFYGCGSPIPPKLDGLTVLDLGSGSGQDCYVLSQLVGQNGQVIGVDMTEQQLDVARKYIDYHTKKFGYSSPNVKFVKHFIEDLSSIDDASIDLVVSNCVINLAPEKDQVFAEIYRILKPGGELYFADVFADRRLSAELKADPVIVGECLGGALYTEDYRRQMAALGFHMSYTVSDSVLTVEDEALKPKLAHINFSSQTVRAFKIDAEDREENYGHKARYDGSIAEFEDRFTLDVNNVFAKGEWVAVSGNVANILSQSRYRDGFEVTGDFETHYGGFGSDVFEQGSACCVPDAKAGGCC